MKTRAFCIDLLLCCSLFSACSNKGNEGAGSAGTNGSSVGSCAELSKCCSAMTDASQKAGCENYATINKGAADADSACASVLAAYRRFNACGGGGAAGMGSGGSSGSGGVGSGCADLEACCSSMGNAVARQACSNALISDLTNGNPAAACAAHLQTYEANHQCGGGVGGAGGQAGHAGSSGAAGGDSVGGHPDAGECKVGGQSCQAFGECCSDVCAAQVCTSCVAVGNACATDPECCRGMTCYEHKCASCKADDATCVLASDCCSNICKSGVCEHCHTRMKPCSNTAECCSGLTCNDGVCDGPGGCESADDCGDVSKMICDPKDSSCKEAECKTDGSEKCETGLVCLAEKTEQSIGACFRTCNLSSAPTGCPQGESCVPIGADAKQICLLDGEGQPYQPCEPGTIDSGCVAGYGCANQVLSYLCVKICLVAQPDCPGGRTCQPLSGGGVAGLCL